MARMGFFGSGYIYIQHALKGGEKSIRINGRLYKVDGFHESSNTIFMFQGTFFHGCPNWFPNNRDEPIYKGTTETLNLRFAETIR